MTDLLYLCHGRLEFTQATLPTLLQNTDLSLVNEIVIYNDATPEVDAATSTYIRSVIAEAHETILFRETNLRSPVAVMNHFLARTKAERFAKIDNDIVVCPGWLQAMTATMDAFPEVDLLGMEPGHGERPNEEPFAPGIVKAPHIGGVGLMKVRAFRHRPTLVADGRFGFTEWQHTYEPGSFWISPDLPVFSLDVIPVEPWLSLRERYIKQGINRAWPILDPADSYYWEWWTNDQA